MESVAVLSEKSLVGDVLEIKFSVRNGGGVEIARASYSVGIKQISFRRYEKPLAVDFTGIESSRSLVFVAVADKPEIFVAVRYVSDFFVKLLFFGYALLKVLDRFYFAINCSFV